MLSKLLLDLGLHLQNIGCQLLNPLVVHAADRGGDTEGIFGLGIPGIQGSSDAADPGFIFFIIQGIAATADLLQFL